MKKFITIEERNIGENFPTYFIADIAANHDGDLNRAIELIFLAADAGADAVKFQHFQADKIVSDFGFKDIKKQQSHQSKWKKTVYEVYEDASVPRSWTHELQEACIKAGIHFFSAPYDFEAIDLLDKANVPAHKIGSGDITWTAMLERVLRSKKPIFLATGASNMIDVKRAMSILKKSIQPVCLMQCNTNYTGTIENFSHIHLNVLKTYSQLWPDVVLGLSDHTPGHSTVLGAVAFGARAIEKHFTDDKSLEGPDHAFSMNPQEWREMVNRTRELEAALGSSKKFVAENENETVVIQRRCLRAKTNLKAGTRLEETDLEALRPANKDAIMPYDAKKVYGRILMRDVMRGEHITFFDVK
jgi:sialic acid synthase SpsE